jgi:uncharacterized membrane protein YfcA
MGPLGMLLALTFGSAVCLTAGLLMSLAVLLLAAPNHQDFRPLVWAVVWGLCLTTSAGLALRGELRQLPQRRPLQLLLSVVMAAMAWHYWPDV